MAAHRHRSWSLVLIGLLVLGLSCPLQAFSVPSISPTDSLRRRQRLRTPDRMVDHQQRQAHPLLSSVSGGAEESIPLLAKIKSFSEKNFFVLGMLVAVSLARLFPQVRNSLVWAEAFPHRRTSLTFFVFLLYYYSSGATEVSYDLSCSSESLGSRSYFCFRVYLSNCLS